jgi:hypothetical protein
LFVLSQVNPALLGLYRERNLSPDFWAEPFNALTNISFLLAAAFAWDFASRRRVTSPLTLVLISVAGMIGFGSFYFHTVPNRFTMCLDIVPIVLFQVLFLWLVSHKMLSMSRRASAAIVIGVVGSSFALLPFHAPMNGSLFYVPPLVAMWMLGTLWAERSKAEPYLLVVAASCFTLAVAARSTDWIVPWPVGTHFVWHLLNGAVVYLVLRAWVVHTTLAGRSPNPSAGLQDVS